MKSIIVAFILIVTSFHANGQALEVFELDKFIGKNWQISDVDIAYCQFFYYSIIVDTDKQGIIKSWKYNNLVPTEVKKNFDHLKTFQFPEKYKLKNSTILFYITVDQTDLCRKATAHIQQTTEVMTEVLKNIALAINTNPKIKVMYRPVAMKYYQSIP